MSKRSTLTTSCPTSLCRRWTTLAALLALAVLVAATPADAGVVAGAGGAMPWEAPLTTIVTSLQGPVAVSIITAAIVVSGLLFAFSESGGMLRAPMGIVFGGSAALGVATFLPALFGAGAGAVF